MAPVNPPSWMQAGTYSAQMDRQTIAGLMTPAPSVGALAARSGVKPSPQSGGLRVAQRSTPDMWVTVQPGACYIAAASPLGGTYVCSNDAPYDVQLTAAHASLPRRDLIVARVYDAIDDVGSDNQVTIEVVTGTPASSPVRPAVPGQALALADVLVPAASSSVVDANITDLRTRTVALGGVLPAHAETAVPTQPYPGQPVYRSDLNAFTVYDGAAWQSLPFGGWSSYTPTWTSDGTQPSIGNGTRNGRYLQIGKTVIFWATVRLGSTSNIGTGYYKLGLPVAARAGDPEQLLFVRLTDLSAGQSYLGQGLANGTTVTLTVQGAADLDTVGRTIPFTFASGDSLGMGGIYEAA